MTNRLALAGGVAIALASCERAPVAAAPPAPPVDAEASAELIVGSARGLEAWRRDGSGKRVISAGAALHPRWLDAGTVVVLRGDDDDLAKGGRLEKIALADGKRTKIAQLPRFACAKPDADAEPDPPLSLQDESDFAVDRARHRAALTIMDRNLNMADIILAIRVDLTTGKVERWLGKGGDEHPCAAPPGVDAGEPPDGIARPAAAPPASLASPVPGYDAESTSPSGRWVVLGGDVSEGDYVHRSLVLLDRTTGDVFPIRPKGGPWPAALPRPPRLRVPVQRTISVVGETETRWLGTSIASELLVIDGLVVRPGVASFSVKGRVAR